MPALSRRRFLHSSALFAASAAGLSRHALWAAPHDGIPRGPFARQDDSVQVLLPRDRVPVSFIIDDSTCLVNMGSFCMPQFAACYPTRADYQKPWETWPREIPDNFVREFGEWCAAHGVKGKYSIVPYPACVGWLDRELPGWSRRQLLDSLKLVRELMLPNWDIHPEMITHTRVIDLKTGRPIDEISAATMENSYPQSKKSVDELAAYLAYALRILKNCDLPCEGITTPGGFGKMVKPELSLAVHDAVRDVYSSEIPHYFKYVVGDDSTTAPMVEHVRGLGTDDLKATVNVVAGTGDWFGGWDGDLTPAPDKYITADGQSGRLAELIRKREPAVFLCHWAGLFNQGAKTGLRAFQRVVTSVNEHYRDQTLWMKLTEMARYWAARELTTIERQGGTISLSAPYACPAFTVRVATAGQQPPQLTHAGKSQPLKEISNRRALSAGTWLRDRDAVTLCFDLARGNTDITA